MPITIYGTDWCNDTRRTRAFLSAKGIRPNFIDIDARPDEARHLSIDARPISIPIVIFSDGTRLDDPTEPQLEETLRKRGKTVAVHHRTALNQALGRFEQYRNGQLVASADFVDRDGTIVIVGLDHHEPRDASLDEENVERLTSGLLEIVKRSSRKIDIDLEVTPTGQTSTLPSEPSSAPEPQHAPAAETNTDLKRSVGTAPDHASPSSPFEGSTAAAIQLHALVETCPLTQQFSEWWSSGAEHREAARLARSEGVGRLAIIKGLHAMWEMPLTPEAMALAFDEARSDDLAAMFHVLGWIIEQNPTSTMSEFQAFDDATGMSVKTHALSLAKRPRDTIIVVDRIGPGLNLRTIDEQRARDVAGQTIREQDGLLRIQDQSTLRLSFGWIFLYQSTEYLETGDYSAMIAGNAPLLVDRFTGALWVTGTEQRPDVYAENYMATGNPIVHAASLTE